MKKAIIFFILLFVLCSFITAVAPVTTIFTGDTGLNVEVNIMPTYKYGEARWSVIHVFNQSNGFQLNNFTNPNMSCHMHLRNSQGFEIIKVKAMTHDDHWDLNGSGGGMNPIGLYAWTLACNDNVTITGGYASGYFSITENGFEDDKTIFLPLILAVFVFCIILLYIAFNLEEIHIFLKLIILFAVIFLQIYLGSVIINLVVLTNYTSIGSVFYNAILWFIRIFTIYVFVYFMYSVLKYFETIPKIKGWKK